MLPLLIPTYPMISPLALLVYVTPSLERYLVKRFNGLIQKHYGFWHWH
jgi:hypothetical protein